MTSEALLMVRDVVRCPACGAADIVYTCEPKCCFNHLCAECRTTFQLLTRKREGERLAVRADVELPESSDPTAACAACESLRVYAISAGEDDSVTVACADCGAALDLAYDDVSQE
jgi:hypothetical protein